jgi:hypothetical protein
MSEEKTIEDYLSKQGGYAHPMPEKTIQQITEESLKIIADGMGIDFKKDPINHPPHYNKGKVECIDAIESAVSDLNGIEAVCTANAIKYLYRWKAKDGVESLKKARWYLNKLINTLEDE